MRRNNGNIAIGLLFIAFGVLYLGSLFSFWPFISFWSIAILTGSAILAFVCLRSRNFIGGFFFIGIFLTKILDVLPYSNYFNMFHISTWNIIILSLLFGFGAQLLIGGRRNSDRGNHNHYYDSDKHDYQNTQTQQDYFDAEFETESDSTSKANQKNDQGGYTNDGNERIFIDNTFRETTRYIMTSSFKGGEISNSFGETTIHLTQAQMDLHGAHLAVNSSFGSVNLYIPREWAVNTEVNVIFGALNDDRFGYQDSAVPNLRITGSVSFGELKIIYV